MRLLFYYTAERAFTDEDGNIYMSGNFPPEVWERYLSVCPNLTGVLRDGGEISRKEAEKTKQKIDTSRINIILMPDQVGSLKEFLSWKRRKYVNNLQKELIESHDVAIVRIASNPMVRKCRKSGIPYVIEVVGCPWDAYWNHSIKGKIVAPFAFLYARREIKKAKWLLYVTDKFLQKRYPSKAKQVSCSNVSLSIQPDEVLEKRIEKIHYNKSKKIIGTAAALDVKYKGQQYVIKMLGLLKKEGITNFEYQLVGGGDSTYLLNEAKRYDVEDQVKIIGQVPHDQVLEWLQTIDIYIQPSLQEGLPRSVIEAMGFGVPCVGTRVAGIPELLDEEMLFRGKNVNELTNIVKNLSEEKMHELAIRNFNKAKEYDLVTLQNRRKDFYTQFIASVQGGKM